MIELKSITKSFPLDREKKVVLDDVSLVIDDGEMLAVMGASGSGKSTLLNIIGCMEDADNGIYMYRGSDKNTYKKKNTTNYESENNSFELSEIDVTALSNREREMFRKNTISFVFQQFALITDMTLKENIELPLKARNIPKKERNRLIDQYVKMLGISDQIRKMPPLVSGGQQQRCAIARALVTGNPVILADEPTGALDQKTGIEIMKLLKSLSREGKTVIVVTHDEKVAKMADRIIRIEDGRIIE